MRTCGLALATILALASPAIAELHSNASEGPVPKLAEETRPANYPLEWQRRLLAVQAAFAATLQPIDAVETGSITPRAQ